MNWLSWERTGKDSPFTQHQPIEHEEGEPQVSLGNSSKTEMPTAWHYTQPTFTISSVRVPDFVLGSV